MEASLPSFGLGLMLLVLTLTWAWRVLNWVWLRPKKLERFLRQQGLSGNSYRFLFGDLKETSRMFKDARSRPIGPSDDILPRVFPFVLQSVNTHGKDCFTWIGPTPRVIIMNPEHIKDVFAKIDDFQKPASNPVLKMLAYGLVSFNGEKWALHKKIINPAFHLEKLKLMLPLFYASCTEMVRRWEKLVSAGASPELNVWPELRNLTRDVIARTAFGSSYEEGRRIFELQEEQSEIVMKLILTVYIPGWRFVPTKTNRRMKHITNEVNSLLLGMISKREKAMRTGEARADDLLGMMLESNMKEIQEHRGSKNRTGMSIKDVIEECKLFYFAGQETTSTLLVWTMVLLSIHPEWQTRAREEVLQVFGREKPEFDGLSRLKIVTMILYEVLRLYPPIISLSRIVHEETRLGKLTIPAGVQVGLPTILIHQDRELWGEDAKEFNPERFAEGLSKATKNQVSFFPFGWGARICIGQNFALIEAKMAIAKILQRFSFELSPTYAHAPATIVTVQPQHGAQVILRRA
ncbi:hypothetical protein CDL15_Pgr002322 [Punica granatum]|uniref:Cytochrome P450 CYP72A219-like n=2 Tax=Punica granatum TaxID=22663 RepID=A0A218XTS7_PUNGR|nr:hypothetical protein CDL15_Pgr002322 [Punica granatum]